jgi:hypothetical protein
MLPLIYLMVVLFACLAFATPFLTIFLLGRQARLRREFNDLIAENEKRFTRLQRAIGELQSKVAVAAQASPAAPQQTTSQPAEAQAPAPSTQTAPPDEKPAAGPPAQQVPVPRSYPVVSTPVPPSKERPTVTPEMRAEAQPRVEAQPPAKLPTPPSIPAAEKKPTPEQVQHPLAAPPTPPRTAVPPAAAPPSSPALPSFLAPAIPPLRTPAPQPALQQRKKTVASFEETLGTSWFAILGVIMTVIGLALLGKIALEHLEAGGKAFLMYVLSIAILGGGIFLEKRERYQRYGRIAIGGGWALLFFTTFGIHYVPAMCVLDSGVFDSVLMLAVAIAMGAHTLRYQSQLATGLAFLLGYSTVALSQDTVYSLSAGVMLAVGLVIIVRKMAWYQLEVFGILSSYLNHLYWLYGILGVQGAHGRDFPQYQASLALLFFYWLTFRVSYIARDIKTDFEEHISTVSAILNTLLLLGTLKFQSVNPELAYIGLLAVGGLEFTFGQLPATKQRRRAFVLLSVMGAALMLAAVPSHYSGNNVAILWLVGAEILLAAGIIFKEAVFLRLGLFTGLLVGLDLFGFNFFPLAELRAKSEDLVLASGVLFALCAAVFYLNALEVASRWKDSFQGSLDRRLAVVHSYLGAFSAATAAWALFSFDWTAVALGAIMLGLAAANRKIESRHLQLQCALLGMLTLYRAFAFNLHIESPAHLHITTRLITLPILAAIFYATAWLVALRDDQEQRVFRALFSFAGAAMLGFLIWTESPAIWTAPLFLAAGIILALAARRLNLLHLTLQEHAFALAAVLRAFEYNLNVPGQFGPFSTRILTISLIAAGLYAISRRATLQDASHRLIAAYLHTTAATSLLALLMWREASNGWLAAFWALFALALAAVDLRFEFDDLRWQAHALSIITMLRCLAVNLNTQELWHGLSVRLLSLSIVIVIFYAMAQFIRMPEEWRDRDFHHIYSWSASLLGSMLLWYELDPLGRAVGWAVFGFVLFEYGFLRKIKQFRYQAYAGFAAAFVRIFFANLSADPRGDLFGPRTYTVLPLILIFYFVYAQLSQKEDSPNREVRFRSEVLVAYLGTATLMALFYFMFDEDWVVVSYSAVAFALFGAAWFLKREIFLQQGILVTLAAFAHGMAHNLFGSSYFTGRSWSGNYLVVSIAVAILLVTLFFAFPLREEYKLSTGSLRRGKFAAFFVGRPELLQFFVPVVLVTVMLALKAQEAMITVSWGIEGVMIVLLALAIKERIFLRTGFGLLLLSFGKVCVIDLWRLHGFDQAVTVVIVGVAFAMVSFLYIKYQDNIRKYL